jgi:hypothetical protein
MGRGAAARERRDRPAVTGDWAGRWVGDAIRQIRAVMARRSQGWQPLRARLRLALVAAVALWSPASPSLPPSSSSTGTSRASSLIRTVRLATAPFCVRSDPSLFVKGFASSLGRVEGGRRRFPRFFELHTRSVVQHVMSFPDHEGPGQVTHLHRRSDTPQPRCSLTTEPSSPGSHAEAAGWPSSSSSSP